MATTIQARTARVAHLCDGCHWTASLRGKPTIAPGHRYLRHVAFPDGEINQSNRPYTNTECVACAAERDDSAPLLVAGACATYCHGVTPCARPFRHDGEHECQQCLAESRAALLDTVPSRSHRDEPNESNLHRPIVNVPLPA